jgi:hypothetical protein
VSEREYESLRQAYVRLRLAAQKVVETGDEPRVYASQLGDLRRELDGEPQPHGLSWMSVS